MRKIVGVLYLVGLAAIFSGCASQHMKVAENQQLAACAPDEAVVVFMRPSALGGAIQSSVFDASTPENVFVGIVSSGTKVAHKTKPGEHLFMVIGESADFMQADLDAGKTYYCLVTPRMGVWKARFSLKPIPASDLNSEEFKKWDKACRFAENTESAYQWARENATDVQKKREEYLPKWTDKGASGQPHLLKSDGI